MVRILNTNLTSKILYVSSKNCVNLSPPDKQGYNNYVRYILTPQIPAVPSNISPHISLFNAEIPYSFYSINDRVNTLKYQILNKATNAVLSESTIHIEQGNYTIYQLDSAIMTAFANDTSHNMGMTLTLSYLLIPNKLSIKTVNTTYKIKLLFSESTISEILGFTHEEDVIIDSSAPDVVSPYVVKVFDYTNLFVVIDNFSLLNSYNNEGKLGGIIASIPIMNAGSLIYYTNNMNGGHTNILNFKDAISYIDIRIVNGKMEDINFNGKHWQIGILLSYTYEADNIPVQTIDNVLTTSSTGSLLTESKEIQQAETSKTTPKIDSGTLNIVKGLIDNLNV